jgi:hypothetical protein
MDNRANIHILNGTEEEQAEDARSKGLLRIPAGEAEAVAQMGFAERRAWLHRYVATHPAETAELRKRLRNARKAKRRAQRDARKANRR